MRTLLPLTLLLALALAGCSSDSDDNPADPGDQTPTVVDFSDYAAALAAVVPPEYQGVGKSAMIAGNYTMWTEGDYPILAKAIGNAESDEPMSLYRNLTEVQYFISMIEQASLLGEGVTYAPGPDGNYYMATITIDDLTTPIDVPEGCRVVMGAETIQLTRVFKIDVPEAGMQIHVGYLQNQQTETIVTWRNEGGIGTAFSCATKNLTTGAISIRGAFYKVTPAETASWIYDIATAGDDNTEFVYNMAWYSSTMGDAGGLSCVNGSGDKDVAFGLRYHQYRAPWTRGVYDQWGPYEQLFGPVGDNPYADLNVSDEYPAEYANLLNEPAMFVYDDMPHAMFASPFATE
jgi:hypothetical protein